MAFAPSTIELRSVSYSHRHGGVSDVSVSALPGEWIALFGGSGSGKSTLLRLLAGRLRAQTGKVCLPRGMAGHLSFVPEGARINTLFTPHQVLAQRLSHAGIPASQRAPRLAEAMEWSGLYPVRDVPARELSFGSQRLLALAAALAAHPLLILLDNVLAGLSGQQVERLFAHVDARRRTDGLILMHATTDSAMAERADRVLMLDEGRALAYAPPEDLLAGCVADQLTVEAADPEAVQRTLRGIFDVEIIDTPRGLRFAAADGLGAAAQILRHPAGGARVVYLQKANLWDALAELKQGAGEGERGFGLPR